MRRTARHAALMMAIAAITALASPLALACCSGLLIIPTATTVGDGQYSYEYQTDGVIQGLAASTRLFNNQFGIGKRFELGADVDLNEESHSRLLGNAKYVAYQSGSLAAAAGISNVADHWKPAPYFVTSVGLHGTNLHLGTMGINGSGRCIFGIDRQFDKLTLMGDYTSGSDVASSIGLNYQFRENFAIMAGAILPRGGNDTGFTLHFVWCEPFRM